MTVWLERQEVTQARPRLMRLAYRLLGSRADAEDVVQDAWLAGLALSDPPDRPEAAGKHFFGRGTDDHVIAVVAGAAEQFIADSAANDENLHSRPGQRLSGRRDSGSCRACPWGC